MECKISTVCPEMIEKNEITLEDGLSFATNQNNLLLQLKGFPQPRITQIWAATASLCRLPGCASPAGPKNPNSMLDMIE